MLPVSAIAFAFWCEAHGVGLLNYFAAPFLLKFAVTVIVNSIAFHAIHYVSHMVPLLWRLHSIHHPDHFVDASTSLRSHPLEHVFNVFYSCLLIGIFGFSPGVLFVTYTLESLLVIFNHSHVGLPLALEKKLSRFIVTPVVHHIHHSSFQPETDSNYGTMFVIWDKLFGTFRADTVQGGPVVKYGLDDVPPEAAGSLDAQLLRPFTMGRSSLSR